MTDILHLAHHYILKDRASVLSLMHCACIITLTEFGKQPDLMCMHSRNPSPLQQAIPLNLA